MQKKEGVTKNPYYVSSGNIQRKRKRRKYQPLVPEVVVVGDIQLELTFSPQQIDTTIPSSDIRTNFEVMGN